MQRYWQSNREINRLEITTRRKIQVVYYSDGRQYKEHYDCFETDTRAGKMEIERAGQRMFTALGYLNNVEEGGATGVFCSIFPLSPNKAPYWSGKM